MKENRQVVFQGIIIVCIVLLIILGFLSILLIMRQSQVTPVSIDSPSLTFVEPTSTTAPPTPTVPDPEELPNPVTPEPTELPFIATVKNASECYNGPEKKYQKAPNLYSNTNVDVLGKDNQDGSWFLVDSEIIDICWTKAGNLEYEFNIDALALISVATTTKDSVCRTGPSTKYKEQTFIPKNWRIVVNGKNNEQGDWLLVTPHDSTIQCWISSGLLRVKNPPPIYLVETPYPPTTVPTPTRRGGGNTNPTPGGSNNPTPTQTPIPPTPTLCWPPGHCK